jgi:hypothetical protein
MSQTPYSPPHSTIAPSAPRFGLVEIGTLVLIALQLLFSTIYLRVAWVLMRNGDASPLIFFTSSASTFLLALGGVLLFKAPRVALGCFLAAGLFGIVAFFAWAQPLVPLLCSLLSLGASAVCLRRIRSFAKV